MWLYEGAEQTEIPEGMIGFVYLITSLIDDRKYIGKKLYHSSKTKQVKGKKKKVKIESDWREYYGSNDALKEEVKKHGAEFFKREIIHQCASKGVLGYLEAREQFDRRVLETDEYFNSWIMIRVRQDHLGKLQKNKV